MRQTITIPGWTIRHDMHALILRHPSSQRMLSSAPIGGGWTLARTVVIRFVPKGDRLVDPAGDLNRFARVVGIHEPFIGFLTTVVPNCYWIANEVYGDLCISIVATVGLSNAASAGVTQPVPIPELSTINLIVLVNRTLEPSAMVNAVITATEAKVDTLQRHRIHTPEGWPATGTSTDAIAVICPVGSAGLPYAGPVTPVGWAIARAVRKVLEEALP